uniref:Uncharacterized protein n=1 Tax=Anguilla anguilla TaxID=7936 RepID=A0A0E9UKB7_ANGAN
MGHVICFNRGSNFLAVLPSSLWRMKRSIVVLCVTWCQREADQALLTAASYKACPRHGAAA